MYWKTAVTKVSSNHVVTRGYRQQDLIGSVPFPHVAFLTIRGRMPSPEEGQMMDAMMTACVDHGVTPPSTLAARACASSGVPLTTAIAAGVQSIGDVHGGAIENCARLLQAQVKNSEGDKRTPEESALALLSELKARGQRMPGFGHRLHKEDPRTVRLLALAEELGIAGAHVRLARALEAELSKKKPLPINVDGAVGALISDMGFDWRLGKAFFVLGRVVGLTAQVYEEMTRERPMRRMCPVEVEYDGPFERDVDSR
jgi:citrate synthase